MGSFNALHTTTIREFDGGLNVVTDDLNMDTRYSTIETNVYNNINGTKSVRYGTKLFADYTNSTIVTKSVTFTRISDKTYKFNQPANKKLPIGTYISVYDDALGSNLLVSGTVFVSNETTFSIRSYTQDVTIAANANVYLDFIILDITYNKLETKFKSKNTDVVFLIDADDIPEIKYLYIGSEFNTSLEVAKIVDINKEDGYYYIKFNTQTPAATFSGTATIEYNKILGTKIINGTYFIDKLVLVDNKGNVYLVDGEGNLSCVFNTTIANFVNLEAPGGWHDTTSVCFTVFNGILTLWNGIDKPLALDLNNSKVICNYLLDQGTMSNSFVPIAKYALAFNHYLVAGNVYDEVEGRYLTDRLCISAKDSIGTFYSGLSDDTGNDAVNIDLGTVISSNGQNIKGLARYRNQLVVGFDDVTVFGTLGDYIETEQQVDNTYITVRNHNPKFEDVIDKHGCISNRTYTGLGSSLICLDYNGLPAFSRKNLTATITPNRISEKIAPELYQSYINLQENIVEDRIFGILNPKENQYLLFIPNNNNYELTTETVCYAYTLSNGNSNTFDGAWSKFTGWNFDYGITSALNTVFLGKGKKIYILGSIDNPIYADYVGDSAYPPENEEDTSGKAIEFTWELPWTDFGDRAAIKRSRYLALSTTGRAYFNIDLFIDYIYTNKETNELDPNLSMTFVAGDAYGYGDGNNYTTISQTIIPNVQGNQYYGGSRRTNTEFLFAWTTKFKIAKFRINGSSKFKLNINSLTIYYQRGNIRR